MLPIAGQGQKDKIFDLFSSQIQKGINDVCLLSKNNDYYTISSQQEKLRPLPIALMPD